MLVQPEGGLMVTFALGWSPVTATGYRIRNHCRKHGARRQDGGYEQPCRFDYRRLTIPSGAIRSGYDLPDNFVRQQRLIILFSS